MGTVGCFMNATVPYQPPGGPPRVAAPDRAIFAALGEAGVEAMIRDLYDRLHASSIAGLFGPDREEAIRRSSAFFIGLVGGPPLYHQRYGSPAMRARHLAFPIDEAAKDVWLDCFRAVLAEAPERYGFPEEAVAGFEQFLAGFAAWMVNRGAP